jgi:hypothetical protein
MIHKLVKFKFTNTDLKESADQNYENK